jgi:hypothetical protein
MVPSRLMCGCRECTSNKPADHHTHKPADHHTHGLHRVGRGEPVEIGELISDLAERPVHRDVPQCLFGPEPLMDQIVADA